MVTSQRADGRVALAGCALVVLAIVALPLAWSFGRTLSASRGPSEWQLWWPSVSLAAQAASVSLILALIGFWASHRRKGGIWIAFAVIAACALPSYVHALAWSWLLTPRGLAQQRLVTACVLGCSYASVSFLVLLVAFRTSSRKMLEAAWMAGLAPPAGALLVARRAVPSLLAAWLIAFLLGFADFPVADHFRVPTYATEVFARIAAWLDVGAAARLALPVLVTAILTTALLTRAFSRMQSDTMTVTDERPPEHGPLLRTARWLAGFGFVLAIAGVPITILIARIPTLATVASASRALQPDLPGTLVLGLAVGVIASVLGAALSYIGSRRILASARFGRSVAWAALAWPASLVCLGAISLAALPLFRLAGLEWLPLISVLLLRWLVLPFEIWWSFWMRTPVSLEESGWLAGLAWWQTLARLLWKHGGAAFAAGVLLTGCFAINDLTAFVLLAPPGFSTTTLNIFSAVHYGPSAYLAALSLCQVFVIAVLAMAAVFLRIGPARAAR